MKRVLITLLALIFGFAAFAQTTAEEFNEKYTRLAARLGYAGVGIETYLDKWEAAYPDDGRLLVLEREVYVPKGSLWEKLQGAFTDIHIYVVDPVHDTAGLYGEDVAEETVYDDEFFGQAMTWLDKAVELYPLDLVYRADKITCFLSYEKESPDMAVAEMEKLVEMEKKSHPAWVVYGEPTVEGDFSELMSGYCLRLWNIATPPAYEAFFKLSTKLSKLYPKNSNYLDNIGSYWLVAKDNPKKATTYYKKALKLNPSDEVATANLKLIERRKASKK